ncbi:MAG: iron hydrogenase, partial [Oscillospiraceae bacterium]
AKAGKRNGYLLEGMGCPGGCVAGAGTIQPIYKSAKEINDFQGKAEKLSSMKSPYSQRLGELLD